MNLTKSRVIPKTRSAWNFLGFRGGRGRTRFGNIECIVWPSLRNSLKRGPPSSRELAAQGWGQMSRASVPPSQGEMRIPTPYRSFLFSSLQNRRVSARRRPQLRSSVIDGLRPAALHYRNDAWAVRDVEKRGYSLLAAEACACAVPPGE